MKRVVLMTLAAGLFAIGCGDETPSGSSGSGAPAGSGTAVALADSDLPVSADFEEEAEKGISNSNYKSELDALEKEVDATR
ncbi:MAG: hypothetical protein IPK82_01995 [Polyangiaceae bacterium]|nr:hypothetical protein [Polyangiaceae bacterium]